MKKGTWIILGIATLGIAGVVWFISQKSIGTGGTNYIKLIVQPQYIPPVMASVSFYSQIEETVITTDAKFLTEMELYLTQLRDFGHLNDIQYASGINQLRALGY